MAAKVKTKILRVLATKDAKFKGEWAEICDRRGEEGANVEKAVREMIADVRADGDAAICRRDQVNVIDSDTMVADDRQVGHPVHQLAVCRWVSVAEDRDRTAQGLGTL